MAMLIAALAAEGESHIYNIRQIERVSGEDEAKDAEP
jgi:UDP-N-acetylglucosamine enolpyruvyl transferase